MELNCASDLTPRHNGFSRRLEKSNCSKLSYGNGLNGTESSIGVWLNHAMLVYHIFKWMSTQPKIFCRHGVPQVLDRTCMDDRLLCRANSSSSLWGWAGQVGWLGSNFWSNYVLIVYFWKKSDVGADKVTHDLIAGHYLLLGKPKILATWWGEPFREISSSSPSSLSLSTTLGKPSRKKSAVFFNIVQKAFDPPPPFYLNICPILQGVFFYSVFEIYEIYVAPHI